MIMKKVFRLVSIITGSIVTSSSLKLQRTLHSTGALFMNNNTPVSGSHVVPESQLLQALNWRYATKIFDRSKKIDPSTFTALEDALSLSPSSGGMQPWRFTVITDPNIRMKLRKSSYDQPQITDCSHLVVFARRTEILEEDVLKFVQRTATVQGTDIGTCL